MIDLTKKRVKIRVVIEEVLLQGAFIVQASYDLETDKDMSDNEVRASFLEEHPNATIKRIVRKEVAA